MRQFVSPPPLEPMWQRQTDFSSWVLLLLRKTLSTNELLFLKNLLKPSVPSRTLCSQSYYLLCNPSQKEHGTGNSAYLPPNYGIPCRYDDNHSQQPNLPNRVQNDYCFSEPFGVWFFARSGVILFFWVRSIIISVPNRATWDAWIWIELNIINPCETSV